MPHLPILPRPKAQARRAEHDGRRRRRTADTNARRTTRLGSGATRTSGTAPTIRARRTAAVQVKGRGARVVCPDGAGAPSVVLAFERMMIPLFCSRASSGHFGVREIDTA